MTSPTGGLTAIRATHQVPARRGGRVLFCGTPAVILGEANGDLRLRLLADGRHVTAGTIVTADPAPAPDGQEVVYLDGQVCSNCGEPIRPDFDFGGAGPGGWLHGEAGDAQCLIYAEGPPSLPWDLNAWPTEDQQPAKA